MSGKRTLNIISVLKPGLETTRRRDVWRSVGHPLVGHRVFGKSRREYELVGLAWPQRERHRQRGNRPPAVDARIGRAARAYGGWIAQIAVAAQECAAVRVEADDRAVHQVESVVRSPLPVTGDVADDG